MSTPSKEQAKMMTELVEKEERKRRRVKAETVLPKSPAKDWTSPSVQKVATEIIVDEPVFFPDVDGNYVVLKANIPEDAAGRKIITLTHRTTEVVDCGFSMKLPPGYRKEISAIESWANRGLVVTVPFVDDEKVKVMVTNVGKEIIVIQNYDSIARMVTLPVYMFDWLKVEKFR